METKKSGAGTKGGVIVGYSSSGKPVYQSKKRKDDARGKKDVKTKKIISKLKQRADKLKKESIKKSNMEEMMDYKEITLEMYNLQTEGSSKEEIFETVKKSHEASEETLEKCYGLLEKVEKAVKAGYDDIIEPTQTEMKVEEHTAEAEAEVNVQAEETTEVVEEPTENVDATEAKSEAKFDSNLFNNFSLGSTIRQTENGHIVDGLKQSPFDYVDTAKIKNNRNNDY